MKNILDKWALPAIIGLYAVLAIAYSVANPILESPDELLNYENIRYLVDERRLPVLQEGEFTKAHHPPLYYLIGAMLTNGISNQQLEELAVNRNPFWGYRLYEPGADNKSQYLHDPAVEGWPYHDAVLGIRLLRWFSILLGAGAIAFVTFTSRDLFPAEPAMAWGAAAVVAFNPMFIFIQSSVHNDALTNLLAALTLYALVRYWVKGPSIRLAAFIGLAAGLGILSKITFLFLGPVVLLVIVFRSWSDRAENNQWWRTGLLMLTISGGLVLLVSGWWFVRNQLLYGDPTSMELQASIWQPRDTVPDWVAAFNELDYLRDSFWGVFGFGQIVFARVVYNVLWVMDLIALGGILLWAVRAKRAARPYRVSSNLLFGLLLAAPLTAFAATFGRMTVSGSANFGRYLFTAYAVIAPLFVLGLTEWVPDRWRRASLLGVATLFLALAMYGLFGVLRPAYAAPPRFNSVEQVAIDQPRNDVYPGFARLLGFEISPDSAVPGERFDVTLFWEVLGEREENNNIFVQLVAPEGERIAGRDTHPGLGNYPTSLWKKGEVIEDSIPLYVPASTAGPQGLSLTIGFRNEDGERLFTENGQDTITLATVRLAGSNEVEPAGDPVKYFLGENVELIGIEAPKEMVHPGEEIAFKLTWYASGSPTGDYVVFVHLSDETGKQVATFDGPPQSGDYPTHLWQAGDVVIDPRLIKIPEELPEGTYEIQIGWYRLDDLGRLPVSDEHGQPVADSSIPIFSLEVAR